MAHDDEPAAFRAQLATAGPSTTLLVDTYDLARGLTHAVEAAGPDLAAVRIDSGDLVDAAQRARAQLDALGATRTRIVVSGDLDEWRIDALRHAPVDQMLVGTALVGGSGAPTAGFVYKLVAIAAGEGADAPLRPVAKASPGKATRGGAKIARRRYDTAGRPDGEVLGLVEDPRAIPQLTSGQRLRALQAVFVSAGVVVERTDLDLHQARAHHARCRDELSPSALDLDPGRPAFELVERI
jgi:nicotinate phosphoribosyltransferase